MWVVDVLALSVAILALVRLVAVVDDEGRLVDVQVRRGGRVVQVGAGLRVSVRRLHDLRRALERLLDLIFLPLGQVAFPATVLLDLLVLG